MNAYWFNNPLNGTSLAATICNQAYPPGVGFSYSDERHWDNMGFEVLPQTDVPANFATLASLVQPPPMTAVATGPAPTAPTGLRIVGLLAGMFPHLGIGPQDARLGGSESGRDNRRRLIH